jgi:acetyl coenzyme A synthetase (ADP forming)-like protein
MAEPDTVSRSLRPLLEPRSVAVIGASRRRGTVGGELFANLIASGFNGPVFPVNPTCDVVQSVRAYRTILDVPDPVDLAVLVVPAKDAVAVLADCARKGVAAAIVVSAGFREVGGEGVEREEALLALARAHGIRLLGPNCLGVMSSDPAVRLNATFSGAFPRQPGPVSFLSQSGALGAVVLDLAARRGIGLASFVSMGNGCDVSGNDMLEHWEHDDRTRVILMYLESFGNPRKFVQLARRVGRAKPIVVVKSGRTRSGSRAAASHTGTLAGADIAVDALFHQAGVIRVDTTEELFDTAVLLAAQPVPRGRRVAIVTNAGGPGILATDACESQGLELASLSAPTIAALAEFLPAEASLSNPVDMIASATPEHYGRAVAAVLADPGVDSVLSIFVPPLLIETRDVARAISRAAAAADKPVAACFMATQTAVEAPETAGSPGAAEAQVPTYRFPEAAAKALARATGYGEWLGVAESPVPTICVDCALAGNTVEVCRDELAAEADPLWLGARDVPRLLAAYGIRSPESAVARSPEEAAQVAEDMGFPVALKVVSDRITHKTDMGGVILDRRDHREVRQGFERIVARAWQAGLADSVQGVLVQKYLQDGIEAVVGVSQDPLFGHLIMFGLGGEYVELMRDVVFRLHPLTEHDVRTMVRSVKASRLLEGYRGRAPGDEAAVRDLLSRVSQMVTDIPELLEMDLNPVKILPPGEGCVVVDARIRLGRQRRDDRLARGRGPDRGGGECLDTGPTRSI